MIGIIYIIFACLLGALLIVDKFNLNKAFINGEKYDGEIDIIIPAHNEASVIGETIQSIKHDKVNVIVVAHNCNDETAEIAKAHGADKVIISSRKGGKSTALNHGLEYSNAEVVGVFDADAEIKDNDEYYSIIRQMLCHHTAAQTGIGIKNEGFLATMAAIEFATVSTVMRSDNALLAGNGSFIYRDALDKVNHFSESLVDDTKISLELKKQGYKIAYTNVINTYQEGINNVRAFIKQRVRWMTGSIGLAFEAIRCRDLRSIYQTCACLLIPVSFTITILGLFDIVHLQTGIFWIDTLSVFGYPIIMCMFCLKYKINPLWIIAYIPYCFYLVPVVVKAVYNIITKNNIEWVKTPRNVDIEKTL